MGSDISKNQQKGLIAAAGIGAVAIMTYLGYRIMQASMTVITDINIDVIKQKVSKANLQSLYLMATQKLPSIVKQVDTRGKLTLYSLFKQINESDADEVPGNREVTEPKKFQAWMQQRGKSVEQCQMEYVVLFANYDAEFAKVLTQVIVGTIKNIKIDDSQAKAGGVMSKSVPRPMAEDTSDYMKSLSTEEAEILQIYKAIREDKNEELLLKLLEQGRLSIESRNKEGMDVLTLAVDCEFSLETLSQLLQTYGFKPTAADANGRSALHYAVDLENKEIIKLLLQFGADPSQKDSSGSSCLDEAVDDEEIHAILSDSQRQAD